MRKLNLLASVVLALAAAPALAAPAPQSGSLQAGPSYAMDPALTDQGAPRGREFRFKLPMAQSKIFNRITPGPLPSQITQAARDAHYDAATWERQISVYVPASYRDGDAAPVTIVFDGPHAVTSILTPWFELTTRAVDNLSGGKDPNRPLPGFIVIGVQSGPLGQRSFEYTTFNDDNARFIHDEVMPAVLANAELKAAYPRLRFTADPDGHATIGCSAGAAAGMIAAWHRPEWFRRIAGYSAGVTGDADAAPADPARPVRSVDFHSGRKLLENTPKKPLRVFNSVGENEEGIAGQVGSRNIITANERLAEALQKAGYDNRFVYARNSVHCDQDVVKSTLADTLAWIWQGYR